MDRRYALGAAAFVLGYAFFLSKHSRQKRSSRIRGINRSRKIDGFYESYFKKMKTHDSDQFFKYTRMDVALFNVLLEKLEGRIKRRSIKDGIGAEERLALTLHFLSQGSSLQTIAWKYAMGLTTVHCIVKETCDAIWQVLQPEVLKPPSTEAEWLNIAEDFSSLWNFPNCLGALDGKHIRIRAPGKSGSKYYNYKGYHSIVLLATCDANYLFTLVDIGAYGSNSDGGVFKSCTFGKMIEDDKMKIPKPSTISGINTVIPFAFVADAAFPLKSYIQRPYPGRNLPDDQRIFNYRLSRARRCIENAFGILASRWRLLQTEIIADVENAELYVKAVVCLHNFIKKQNYDYCPTTFIDTEDLPGRWRENTVELRSVGRLSSNRASRDVYRNRDLLKNYFTSDEGSLPWQHRVLTEGFV